MATQPDAGPPPAMGALVAQRARAAAESVVRPIAFSWLTPNHLTVIGFFLTAGVAVVIGAGYELLGGVLVLAAGLFDMLDGALARVRGLKTRFGAFLDSTLDRFSEAVLLAGVLWLHHEQGPVLAVAIVAALTGSLLVSYARAKAEGVGVDGEVGFLPRPQRVILLSVGLVTGYAALAVWVLAVLTNVTVVQRILHVRKQLGSH